MRHYFRQILVLSITLFSFISSSQAAEKFIIDPTHSYVLWHVQHFGFSTQAGKWYVNGTIMLDTDKLEQSKVQVSIPITHMVTGIEELNKHLKSKLFFEADRFPTATFVSDKISRTGKNTAKVHGVLTLHGISKPITLNATINKQGVNPITDKMTVGFSANTTLKRSDFGISGFLPDISDEVKLDIATEAYAATREEPAHAH